MQHSPLKITDFSKAINSDPAEAGICHIISGTLVGHDTTGPFPSRAGLDALEDLEDGDEEGESGWGG